MNDELVLNDRRYIRNPEYDSILETTWFAWDLLREQQLLCFNHQPEQLELPLIFNEPQ
jgi:hypothetical protein